MAAGVILHIGVFLINEPLQLDRFPPDILIRKLRNEKLSGLH